MAGGHIFFAVHGRFRALIGYIAHARPVCGLWRTGGVGTAGAITLEKSVPDYAIVAGAPAKIFRIQNEVV